MDNRDPLYLNVAKRVCVCRLWNLYQRQTTLALDCRRKINSSTSRPLLRLRNASYRDNIQTTSRQYHLKGRAISAYEQDLVPVLMRGRDILPTMHGSCPSSWDYDASLFMPTSSTLNIKAIDESAIAIDHGQR